MRIENGYIYLHDRRYDLIPVAVWAVIVAILSVPLWLLVAQRA